MPRRFFAYLGVMKENRVTVWLSVASFLQFMFLGFAGSFVAEVIKPQSDNTIVFWSSFFSFILAILILYIYLEVFSMTRS